MSSSRSLPIRFLLAICLLLGGSFARGYSLNGYKWPDGSQIVMHLGLSHSPGSFPDGTGSWNGSATDALSIWNQYINAVQFVAAAAAADQAGDGANSAFFANNVYGETWPASALAVTLRISSQGSYFTETDVIFNNNLKWSSYRGNLVGSGRNVTYDFHRVALHEFGHVLGLDHPDDHGQSVEAIMNSIISNLDHLVNDDIAGAQSLYGLHITSSLNPPSVRSGDAFSYQIAATGSPTSFSASGLPPGLHLNTATGLISGSCPTSGTFAVNIVAQGVAGSATGTIQIVIVPLPVTSALYVSEVSLGASFSYRITAGNNPLTFLATGLPPGLNLDSNTGFITGVPTVAGTFDVLIKAIGANSEASDNLRIIIPAPRITSYSYPTAVELGDPFSYQITATYNPTSFAVSGLPAGLDFSPGTGLISGAPTVSGFFFVSVTAHTTFGDATGYLYISILAPRITSAGPWFIDIGSAFAVQITASNHPTSFSAIGLPAGLRLNPSTGLIRGVAELSGNFNIQLNAQGPASLATQSTFIEVRALNVTTVTLAKIPNINASTIVADPARPRVYVNTGTSVQVIDTGTFGVTVVGLAGNYASYSDIAISADGSKLWLPGYSAKKLLCIDLNTLTVLPEVPVAVYPSQVRVGSDGRLYLTGNTSDPGVFQVDPTTGETLAHFGPTIGPNFYPCIMEMGADRKTIYIADISGERNLSQYQIAPGAVPVLLQKVKAAANDTFIERIVVNPDGLTVGLISEGPNSFVPNPLAMRSCANMNSIQSTFSLPNRLGQTAFNLDGSLFFEDTWPQSGIKIVDSNTQSVTRSIFLPNNLLVGHMIVDKNNSQLFVVAGPSGSGDVYAYSLKPPKGLPTPSKTLLNVATRLRSQTGDDVLIGGFIISGTEAKKVVLRAIGPSLPVTDRLADPMLELHGADGSLLASNDNWNAHRSDVIASGIPPSDEHESAIVATLPPGAYTAVLSGVAETSGVALVELYDLSFNSNSRIANISTRGKVETGDNVMIGGFIIGGDQPTKVIARAIGPSLTSQNISGALSDTTLTLYDGNGSAFASNDDWQTDQEQEIIATTIPPGDPRESAIVRTLQPGSYTAIVRGKNNTTGVALVEVYNLESN